jgi:hypothetical protein
MKRWSPNNIPSLRGKLPVVTGADYYCGRPHSPQVRCGRNVRLGHFSNSGDIVLARLCRPFFLACWGLGRRSTLRFRTRGCGF